MKSSWHKMHFNPWVDCIVLVKNNLGVTLNIITASHNAALWSCLSPLHYLPCSHTQLDLLFWQKYLVFDNVPSRPANRPESNIGPTDKPNTKTMLDQKSWVLLQALPIILFRSHHAYSSPIPTWFTGLCLFTYYLTEYC